MMQAERGPPLKLPEIISLLTDLGLKVTKDDLAKPTPEKTREIYHHIVDLIFLSEDPKAFKFDAIAHIECPDLHDDAFTELIFMNKLQRLMRICNAPFNYHRDLNQPTAKSLKESLSQIINFLKFREERLANVTEYNMEQDALDQKLAKAEDALNQLSIERDALRLAREKEEPLVRQLEVETTQLQAQIDLLNRQQLQIKNESHTVKAASQEVLDQSAAVKVELTNLRTENSRLKNQIVPMPEKVKKMIEEKSLALENERRHIDDLEKNTQTLRARSEACAKLQKEIGRIVQAVEEADQERTKLKDIKQQTRETKAKVAIAEKNLRELKEKEEEVRRQLTLLQDKQTRQLKTASEKKAQATKELKDAQVLKQQADEEVAIARKSAIELENATNKALHQKMNDAVKDHEAQLSSVREQLEALNMQVQAYHSKLEAAMGIAPMLR